MRARSVVASILAAVFVALAGLHVYWAIPGVAADAVVPARVDGVPVFRPGRSATLAVAAALAAAAALVLGHAGLVRRVGPAGLYRAGTWTLGAVLVLRVIGEFRYVGLFKRERGTRFAVLDTRVYTPLCAGLAAGVLYLAAARRGGAPGRGGAVARRSGGAGPGSGRAGPPR